MKKVNLGNDNIIIMEDSMKKDITKVASNATENIIIFMIQPILNVLDIVISIFTIIKALKSNSTKHLVFVPGENHDAISRLLATQTINYFTIDSLNFDLIPIDTDLLSLENENSLKEMYINNNLTPIDNMATGLVKFEICFGKIKYKYIKGDLAQNFCQRLEEKEKDMGLNTNDELLGMIVLDRSVDFLTLMSSNYTFEGLIDEKIGINLGKMKIKETILKEGINKEPLSSNKLITYGLTSNTNLFYCSVRCMHYLDVNRFILSIREYYKKLTNANKNKGKNIPIAKISELTKEINEFMTIKNKLVMLENILNYVIESIQSSNYIKYIEKEQIMLAGDIPENIYKFYEEHLYEKRDLVSLIKLLVIESLTQNGIKDYQNLKREILNIYGYQYIFLFRDLEAIGWLKEKIFLGNILNIHKNMVEFNHNQLNEKLGLVNFKYDPKNIEDCSYVFGGYCPLSLRLIELATQGKWNKYMDILKKIPGYVACPKNENVITYPENNENIVLIIFLGGITYSEIEGIRYLNRKYNEEYLKQKRNKKIQFVILTTGILNAKKIFKSFGIRENPSFTMKQFYESFTNKKYKKKK